MRGVSSLFSRRAPTPLFRKRRSVDAVIAVALVAVLVTIASCAMFTWVQSQAHVAPEGEGGLAGAAIPQGESSTPQDEWRQGVIPMLFQTDPAWANDSYAGSDIATSGCGPTCLSMVYVALTGKTNMDPEQMAAFSEENGYVQDGLTAWALMTDGASRLGLVPEEIPADPGTLSSELEAGHPVIASMLPGDFTTTGHFIVIAGEDDQGRLIVRDPNSAERSAQTWDVQAVLSQCANLWAYSRG